MENNKTFTLTNGGKASFFLLSPLFLATESQVQKEKNDFFVGRVEKYVAPSRLSSKELHDVVSEYSDIVFSRQSGKHKFPSYGLTHNWVK